MTRSRSSVVLPRRALGPPRRAALPREAQDCIGARQAGHESNIRTAPKSVRKMARNIFIASAIHAALYSGAAVSVNCVQGWVVS